MNPFRYSCIVNSCLAICIISAFTFDQADGGWKILVGGCALSAALVGVITYFYNQYLLEEHDKIEVESEQLLAKKNAEAAVKYAVDENNMTEAEFIKWTNQIWREIVHELDEDDDENDLF